MEWMPITPESRISSVPWAWTLTTLTSSSCRLGSFCIFHHRFTLIFIWCVWELWVFKISIFCVYFYWIFWIFVVICFFAVILYVKPIQDKFKKEVMCQVFIAYRMEPPPSCQKKVRERKIFHQGFQSSLPIVDHLHCCVLAVRLKYSSGTTWQRQAANLPPGVQGAKEGVP